MPQKSEHGQEERGADKSPGSPKGIRSSARAKCWCWRWCHLSKILSRNINASKHRHYKNSSEKLHCGKFHWAGNWISRHKNKIFQEMYWGYIPNLEYSIVDLDGDEKRSDKEGFYRVGYVWVFRKKTCGAIENVDSWRDTLRERKREPVWVQQENGWWFEKFDLAGTCPNFLTLSSKPLT